MIFPVIVTAIMDDYKEAGGKRGGKRQQYAVHQHTALTVCRTQLQSTGYTPNTADTQRITCSELCYDKIIMCIPQVIKSN